MTATNRRQFIKIAGLLTTGTALAGCQAGNLFDAYSGFDSWPSATPDAAWRVLNRVTFGPRPEERRRLAEIGSAAFIEEQLAPDTLPGMDLRPGLRLRRLETLRLDAPDLFEVEEEIVKQELQQAALLRAVYSPRQLEEIMVDFWTNHFHIDQNKSPCAWLKSVDDREVIRPHALGAFPDLLSASAHSPAMLVYLDNQENHAGNPNENYARELLELHTLGLDSGYSQTDIQELARCLTGWTVKKHFYRGQFTFDADQHDDDAKQILGMSVPAGAKQAGGEQIIAMLATHPATARFIAARLVRRFIADEPPPPLVTKAAATFLKTQGDIKAVLRTILLSPEMLDAPAPDLKPKLKRPLEYVAGALRQLNARTNGGPALLGYLAQMGQPLFQWPTPDGFPDQTGPWQGNLITRWRFAAALIHGQISGTTIDLESLAQAAADAAEQEPWGQPAKRKRLAQFATLLLGRPLPAGTTNHLLAEGYNEMTLLATLLSSPAFQWR